MTPLGHLASAHVLAPADAAFAYLNDPFRLGRWSLGCFDTRWDPDSGLHTGRSLFDGSRGWFTIDADPFRMLLDYWVGQPDRLTFRISARVIPGETVGYESGTCLVMLSAWRPATMPAERWLRLCASHDAEIWLIKAQIESENSSDASRGDVVSSS
jgi:hypothetical protein